MHHNPGFLKLVDESRTRIRETDVATVRGRLDRREVFYLVDVREESEWAAGHLPSAVHLSKGIIERDVESRFEDKGAEIVLYCGGGYRSVLAAVSLKAMGYTNVSSMDGGFRVWIETGLTVVKGL